MNYIKAIIVIIGWLDSLSAWLSKRGKVNAENKIDKILDTNNDAALADELRRLAEKVESRKKSN